MKSTAEEVYEFGIFRLDVAERRLSRDGVPVPVPPKLFDTLTVLVRAHGRLVPKDAFLETVWPDMFVSEATLAHNISALRKLLGHTPETPVIETVAKSGYRFVAGVRRLGSDASIEMTTDSAGDRGHSGPPFESSVAGAGAVTADLGAVNEPARHVRWLAVAVGIVLVSILGVWATGARVPRGAAGQGMPPVRTLAVLPFTPVGQADPVLEIGLADTLIGRLGGLRDLTVRPLGAVRSFSGANRDAIAVGRQLKVDAVLEGTVERRGGTTHVQANLVRVADEVVIWSAAFNAPGDGLLRLQDALVAQIASALLPKTGGSPSPRVNTVGTGNPLAYDAYLKGRYFFARRDRQSLLRAMEHLETAVRLDRGYALAHNALADVYHSLGGSGFAPQQVMIPKTKLQAHTAHELDPTLADPWATLALIAMNYDWEWDEAERLYRRAIALDPNHATAHAWYGEFLGYMGAFDEGLAELRLAHTLDPLSLVIATDIGRVLILARRYDEAIREIGSVLDVDPTFQRGRAWMAVALSMAGRHDEAFRYVVAPESTRDEADHCLTLAQMLARAGRVEEAESRIRQAREAERASGSYHYPPAHAIAYGYVGDLDKGFAELERMIEERTTNVINLRVDPGFDAFRRDRRFGALLERVRLAAAPNPRLPGTATAPSGVTQ